MPASTTRTRGRADAGNPPFGRANFRSSAPRLVTCPQGQITMAAWSLWPGEKLTWTAALETNAMPATSPRRPETSTPRV